MTKDIGLSATDRSRTRLRLPNMPNWRAQQSSQQEGAHSFQVFPRRRARLE